MCVIWGRRFKQRKWIYVLSKIVTNLSNSKDGKLNKQFREAVLKSIFPLHICFAPRYRASLLLLLLSFIFESNLLLCRNFAYVTFLGQGFKRSHRRHVCNGGLKNNNSYIMLKHVYEFFSMIFYISFVIITTLSRQNIFSTLLNHYIKESSYFSKIFCIISDLWHPLSVKTNLLQITEIINQVLKPSEFRKQTRLRIQPISSTHSTVRQWNLDTEGTRQI
jgi:hypothetical protein